MQGFRMWKRWLLGMAFVSLLGLFFSPSAHAFVTLFTDRALFLAASVGTTTIDFEENPPGLFTYYGFGGPAVFDGVTFTSAADLFTVDPGFFPPFYDWGSGDVLSDQFGGSAILATLPPGFTAVGSDYMSFDPFGSDFVITLSTGDVFILPSEDFPTRAFAGFISDVPITTITFDATSSEFMALDNFTFGFAGDRGDGVIPEPGSLSLLGMGLAAFGALKRRRKV